MATRRPFREPITRPIIAAPETGNIPPWRRPTAQPQCRVLRRRGQPQGVPEGRAPGTGRTAHFGGEGLDPENGIRDGKPRGERPSWCAGAAAPDGLVLFSGMSNCKNAS